MSKARSLADLISGGATIEASEIADSTITGGKLASDIVINTSGNITTTGAFTSTGIDDNATSTAITIDSSQNVSFNDDTGNTAKMVWNATDESLKINAQYGDLYVAYKVPQISPGGVTSDLVLLIGEKDVNEIRITGRFYSPTAYPTNNNRNMFSVDIVYQQWNSQIPRFSYDAIHTGSRANHADNMELAEVVYDGKTYYAITIQANYASLGGQPIYFTGGITNTTDLGWVTRSSLTSYTAVTPSSNDSSDKRISAENIRFKNEKNEDKMLIISGGDISFYEDTGTTPKFFWDASAESLGIGTSTPATALHIDANVPNIRLTDDAVSTSANARIDLYGSDARSGYVGMVTGNLEIWNQQAKIIRLATSNTERMRIDSSGNVGIGTSGPSEKLDVFGNVRIGGAGNLETDTKLYVANTGGDAYLQIKGADSTGTVGIKLGRNSNAVQSGMDWSASDNALKFYTNNFTERMRIDLSGRVGIGETSMDAVLVIKGDTDATTNPSIRLKDGSDTREAIVSNQSGDLVLATMNSSDNVVDSALTIYTSQMIFKIDGSEAMRINSSRNIGIGTTSPTAQLDVAETIQIDNTVTIGGSAFTGEFDIQLNNLATVNGNQHKRYGLRLSYAGIAGNATNGQQKDVLIYIAGLTSWTSAVPIDTGGGTIAVTVTSSSSNSMNIRVTTPASTCVGAYVATLFASGATTMICYG